MKNSWTEALPKSTDKKPELVIKKVERLNADGSTTDITDKPDEWFPKLPPQNNSMSNELNVKIISILKDGSSWLSTGRYSPPNFDEKSAANSLERLVLESQIELLQRFVVELNGYGEPQASNYIEDKILNLTTRLKQLKP